jgi:hypothetical protein
MNSTQFVQLLRRVFAERPLPKPLHLVVGVERLNAGEDLASIRRELRTTGAKITEAAAATDPVAHLIGMRPEEVTEKRVQRARLILGQLVLGRAAEVAFEELYEKAMSTHEFELRDHRTSRSGTDYRVHNGGGRPLYRLNIKFHGSQFKRGPELVGLEPRDCFALATYKIKNALDRQDEEHLPYIFAIVGVPHLTGAAVAENVPDDLATAVAIIAESPKVAKARDFEDQVVEYLVSTNAPVFVTTLAAIRQAPWYVLSARRAFALLTTKLFDRVFALRIRGFAQQFRSAELDMHFSLKDDLTPLEAFFGTLRKEGQTKVASLLERGSM